ncbi:PE domain-containing protein [Mycobacterium sp.]|uniref:PE domain-containing protein n=1 Tax=Mycobacterium sp. TaxID=1785 RepID=UPI003BAD147E
MPSPITVSVHTPQLEEAAQEVEVLSDQFIGVIRSNSAATFPAPAGTDEVSMLASEKTGQFSQQHEASADQLVVVFKNYAAALRASAAKYNAQDWQGARNFL